MPRFSLVRGKADWAQVRAAGCPRSLEQAVSLASSRTAFLPASTFVSLLSACASCARAQFLNAMPRRASAGPEGESPSPSDWLLWFFHKNTRVWSALDQARKAYTAAGADPAWQHFAARILECFEIRGIPTKKFDKSAHHCFDSLATLAGEATRLAEDQPDNALRNIMLRDMMVCVFLLLLPADKADRSKTCRISLRQLAGLKPPSMPTKLGRMNRPSPLSFGLVTIGNESSSSKDPDTPRICFLRKCAEKPV